MVSLKIYFKSDFLLKMSYAVGDQCQNIVNFIFFYLELDFEIIRLCPLVDDLQFGKIRFP